MASEGALNIFAFLRSGREGAQFERFFRAVSFVLHQWYEYEGERKPDLPDLIVNIRAIQFDKLITFVGRLWDELYRQHEIIQFDPVNGDLALELSTDKVRFPCPMQEKPGKHGPGRAIYDGQRRVEFATSVLYKLQEDDIIHYFTITPPTVGGDDGRQRVASPAHPDTTITPAIQTTDKRLFLDRFNQYETEIVMDLANVIRRLNQSEIRALGTHATAIQTRDAIRWEFAALKRKGIYQSIRAATVNSAPATSECQEWLEYSDEACSKAHENRTEYESAWSKLTADLTIQEIKAVFASTQAAPGQIWDNDKVKELWPVAAKARATAKYFLVISNGLEDTHRRSNEALSRAAAACREYANVTLPDSFDDVTTDQGQLLPAVQAVLLNLLDSAFKDMMSC